MIYLKKFAIRLEACPGESLEDLVEEARLFAGRAHTSVVFDFNGCDLVISGDTKIEEARHYYHAFQNASKTA